MNIQPVINDAAKLAVLVNPERIRSSVKRLFRNSIAESMAEVLQNAQRAGAKHVAIVTATDSFSIQDDGHGILNGIDGFHTLLKLAESSFDNPTIEDQDPMGIGLVSLLTHDQVNEVTFASGNLRLTIDSSRWWTDRDYYSTWFERIETVRRPIHGFRISVRCKPELVTDLKKCLEPKNSIALSSNILDSCSPAQGYSGILKITLNKKPVSTDLPAWATFDQQPLIITNYQGCPLKIDFDPRYSRRSSVRWYGQLIAVRTDFHNFYFHLDVQQGHPINPLSPTRAGIIQDDAFKALLAFVEEEIFSVVFDVSNRDSITAEHVNACYHMDQARSLTDSPYITARELLPLDNPSTFEEAQPEKPSTVLTYDEAPLLLEEGLNLVLSDTIKPVSYGLNSFVNLLPRMHTLQNGNRDRLKIGELYWKPGVKTTEPYFHQAGEFGISYTSGQQPSEWTTIPADTTVFCFEEPSSYDVEEIDFTVGTDNPVVFLQGDAWSGFQPSDTADYDPQHDNFGDSVDALIRKLKGNCVPRQFSLYELEQFIESNEAVKQVVYRYQPDIFNDNGTLKTIAVATGITLHTSTGRKIELSFY